MPERDQTRQRILKAAEELVMREGLQPLTMARIASELGMSKKTIYTGFRDKEELLYALVNRHMDAAGDELNRVRAAGHRTFPEKLQLTLGVIHEVVRRIGPRLLDDLARLRPDIWREVDAQREEHLLTHFRSLLKQGAAEGLVRDDVDMELATLLVVRAITSVIRPEEVIALPYSLPQIAEGLFSMLFGGVLTEQGLAGFRAARKQFTEEWTHGKV